MDWDPDHIGFQSRIPPLPMAGCRGMRGIGGLARVSGGVRRPFG